ncbi:MAG: hypothetical protein LBU58_10645 [Clostridiales bacterium]|jgi:putative aldouronate transport system permease protein|nr:hypothetical protein [Clostridiales bacterium]
MGIKKGGSQTVFNIFGYGIIALVAAYCLFPLALIISGSFTRNDILVRQGYALWPRAFSLSAYSRLFEYPEGLLNAYATTVFCTAAGTFIGLLIITMTGYEDCPVKGFFNFFTKYLENIT